MLILFESASGYAVFKVLDEGKLANVDNIYKEFKSPEKAANLVKLKAFRKFESTTDAMKAAVCMVDGKLDKNLKSLLKDVVKKDSLGVADSKLGGLISDKVGINCLNDEKTQELMRGIRSQFESLVAEVSEDQNKAYSLGLSHGLSRYKLKFSPDKVDTMIVQAINLLDELDKEINIYAMRVREWYGWHFPEMGKIVTDNLQFAKVILKMGTREKCKDFDFSDILEEDIEAELKEVAEVSMGTEIGELDVLNIKALSEQVQDLMEYRIQLFDYLKNRPMSPKKENWDKAVEYWKTLKTDADAQFDKEINLAAEDIVPMVTWGTSPQDVAPINGKVPNPENESDIDRKNSIDRSLKYMGLKPDIAIKDIKIDTVFIGSC